MPEQEIIFSPLVDALPWLVLFLPLAAAAALLLAGQRFPQLSAYLSIGASLAVFAASIVLMDRWVALPNPQPVESSFAWLTIGQGSQIDLEFRLGWRIDGLALMMLLVVTGIGALIHIYSWGYMREDSARPRYFAGLSLFLFSMLGIVLANNLLMTFVFWELVGVSSYLLIGHWRERPAAADAAKKAFITNRLGDFGFLLGIILVWASLGSLNFTVLEDRAAGFFQTNTGLAALIGLLLFCGAMGKSAQFPLHVWLPDAMEGPTPVSALIHAATMVAAGVFMLCRIDFLITDDIVQITIAFIGGFTALLAALIALQQNDIKRILAYSTLSQLGYMVLAVGMAGVVPAMFHLTTHAAFKALLFLGAGAVITALHHQQDIWKMGGLRERMPITYWTFLIGTLALCGLPPFSGFFSKDMILAQAWENGQTGFFLVATGVTGLTALYMFRLFFVAFEGPPRSAAARRAEDQPWSMTLPLVILAVPSVLAGLMPIDKWYHVHFGAMDDLPHATIALLGGLAMALLGALIAWRLYAGAKKDPLPSHLQSVGKWLRDRFYFDEMYERLNHWTQENLSRAAAWVDRNLIAGLAVQGTSNAVDLAGRLLRLLQTGNLQTYTLLLALAVLALLILFLS